MNVWQTEWVNAMSDVRDIVNLEAILEGAIGRTGPIWGVASADLNATLLVWKRGDAVQAHINDEVDVVIVVLRGQAALQLDGTSHHLNAGDIAVLPKGLERSMVALSDTLVQVNIHRRRNLNVQSTVPKVRT